MYTVLIQSKKTLDSLQQFYPILAEAIEAGEMDACQWIESGETIETAVPELYDLVSHKRIWRAMIVCAEPDAPDTEYPVSRLNPFDFLENKERDGLTIENGEFVDCAAPLIRLTHLLGGVPAPSPQFEAKLAPMENKIPRVEYHPVSNEETALQKKAYSEWTQAHKFQGLAPAEIILIKARRPFSANDSLALVRSSWQVHTEADSSEFWKRNLYPHNCRFLVFDMDQRGVMQQQDLFKLWLSILLISRNNIDPNVLQAHRLYNLDILLNERMLRENFQRVVNKLNMARYQIEKSIEREDRTQADSGEGLPDFSVGIPVSFQLPRASGMSFDNAAFGLTGGTASGDLETWEKYGSSVKKELQALLHSVERTLDHAASRLREQSRYTDEVTVLNTYQEEDLNSALDAVYREILESQEAVPAQVSDVEAPVTEMDEAVRREILQRMSGKQAVSTVAAAVLAVAVCLLPGFGAQGGRWGAAVLLVLSAALLTLTGIAVLAVQRRRLLKKVSAFQMSFHKVLSELSQSASAYSRFLSGVATHIRGKTYLNRMRQKVRKRDSAYYFKQQHLAAIQRLIAKISLWSAALHVDVDLQSVNAIELMDDAGEGINYDELYYFLYQEYEIPLNQTGAGIRSPFDFVERLIIEREEMYDDVWYD